MDKDPRYTAFIVLMHWHRASHTLDRSLAVHAQELDALSKKDRTLCNALIFGVLRRREAIDWIIGAFSHTPLKKIKLKALYLLRIALYQVMYMDRIPVFAAINTAVEIAKKDGGRQTAGFVNAILRKASKAYADVALPDPKKDETGYLSVRHAMPVWLAEKWIRTYGFKKAEGLCSRINQTPMITLRTNTLKTNRSDLEEALKQEVQQIIPTGFAGQGLRFSAPAVPISRLDTFRKGWFQIQDEAAQLVTEFMAPRPGETNLDACAGLGGKTGHMAQLMNNQGKITALDTEAAKLEKLNTEMKRLGIEIVTARPVDVLKTTVKDFNGYFDRVLVDAPCTGLGVMQRNPDTKWKRRPHDISRLAGRQKKILNAAASLVRPGGLLVYAVCSCETEENEQVIKAFVDKRKDFTIDLNCRPEGYAALMTADGFIKTYPDTTGMDGFFAARLRRKDRS